MCAKCKKQKMYSGVFCATFLCSTPLYSLFAAFHTLVGIHAKSQRILWFIFCGVNKTRNSREMRKCIVSVSYFVVCFTKNTPKCEKYIASRPFFRFFSISHRGWHSREKSKDFVVYFFAALIKHEIREK